MQVVYAAMHLFGIPETSRSIMYAKILTAWAIYGNPSSKLHFENRIELKSAIDFNAFQILRRWQR